jgi:hypothetical protein
MYLGTSYKLMPGSFVFSRMVENHFIENGFIYQISIIKVESGYNGESFGSESKKKKVRIRIPSAADAKRNSSSTVPFLQAWFPGP